MSEATAGSSSATSRYARYASATPTSRGHVAGGSVDTTPWDYQSAEHLAELLDADIVMFRDAGHTVHRTHAAEFADFTRRTVALAR